MSQQTTRRSSSPVPPLPARDYQGRVKQSRQNSSDAGATSASAHVNVNVVNVFANVTGRVDYKQSVSVESGRSGGFENDAHEHVDRPDRRGGTTTANPLLPASSASGSGSGVEVGVKSGITQEMHSISIQQNRVAMQSISCTNFASPRSASSSKSSLCASEVHPNGRLEPDGIRDKRSGSSASVLSDAGVESGTQNVNNDCHDSPPALGGAANDSSSAKSGILRMFKRKDKPNNGATSSASALTPNSASETPPPVARKPHVPPFSLGLAQQANPSGSASRGGTPARTPPSLPPKPAVTPPQAPASFAPLFIDTDPNIVSGSQMRSYLYGSNDSPIDEAEFNRFITANLGPQRPAPAPGVNYGPTLMHANTAPGSVLQLHSAGANLNAGRSAGMGANTGFGSQNGQALQIQPQQLRPMVSVPGQQVGATAYFFALPQQQLGPATAPVNVAGFPYPSDSHQAELNSQKQRCIALRRQLESEKCALENLRREVKDLESRRYGGASAEILALRDQNRALAIEAQFLAFDLDTIDMAGLAECCDEMAEDANRHSCSQMRWRSTPSLADWQHPQSQPQSQWQDWQVDLEPPSSVQMRNLYSNRPAPALPLASDLNQPGYPPRPPPPTAQLPRFYPNHSANLGAQGSGSRSQQRASDLLDDDSRKWSCVACTFLNHPALYSCEICSAARPSN